ncbi:MAG: hypothetical protein GWN62_14640 [Aliifodinibius sp.]|nr:hypothetical protein [Fodinibius sp.]
MNPNSLDICRAFVTRADAIVSDDTIEQGSEYEVVVQFEAGDVIAGLQPEVKITVAAHDLMVGQVDTKLSEIRILKLQANKNDYEERFTFTAPKMFKPVKFKGGTIEDNHCFQYQVIIRAPAGLVAFGESQKFLIYKP